MASLGSSAGSALSLRKLVYLDGRQAVLYRSRMNPFLGPNFEAMDLLELLARLSDHIPDSGQHRTLFCGLGLTSEPLRSLITAAGAGQSALG